MESNVEQHRAEKEDPRDVARRLFKALCELYPDRYIAMIQPNNLPNIRPELPTITTVEAQTIPLADS